MVGVRNTKVKVGQVCWTTFEFDFPLCGRLVKVVSVKGKRIRIRLLNPTEGDRIWLDGEDYFYISSVNSLFTSPEDWRPRMEGSPESVIQPVVEKKPTACPSCNSKVTAKMKFCGECGEKL